MIFSGHRKPDFGEKLKAWVVRVRRDFGPLVQNSSQARGKHGRDAFAPLLARKIRERSIRHGILHRSERTRVGTVSAHPGYVCRLGGKRARRLDARQLECLFRLLFQKPVQRDPSPWRPIKGSVWAGSIDPLQMRNGNFAIEVPANFGEFWFFSEKLGTI